MSHLLKSILVLFFLLMVEGCATVQYAALEKVGVHKRDILVDRVQEARYAQEKAKEQFVSAYERFAALVNVEGGDLEKSYKKLKRDLDRSEKATQEIDERIEAVESVAEDLFDEWHRELDQYSSPVLRQKSEKNLTFTRHRYEVLIDKMKKARARIDPVLFVMQDYTLFLKHNLNAKALASLKGEAGAVEAKVADLVREMEQAIAEADRFIAGPAASQEAAPGGA
ncbi:MAG TPA: DUF2959 domain-containing protein [Chromatiales bacterium]|nr:DUF2959 domain-containing protein [Chromatiales bacterium]